MAVTAISQAMTSAAIRPRLPSITRMASASPGCKSASPDWTQHFYVKKDILGAAKDVGKAKAFGFIKPLYPGRFQRGGMNDLFVKFREIGQNGRFIACGRRDAHNLDRLNAAIGSMCHHFDSGAIGNRTLPKVAQDIHMKENVRPTVIGHDKAEPFDRVKPLHLTAYVVHAV